LGSDISSASDVTILFSFNLPNPSNLTTALGTV
jgi:hypothetical protein